MLTNIKTRTLFLLVGSILLLIIAVILINLFHTKKADKNNPSSNAAVPDNIASTPGAKTFDKYKQLQQIANEDGSKKASKTGDTFVPTIVGSVDESKKNKQNVEQDFLKAIDGKYAPPTVASNCSPVAAAAMPTSNPAAASGNPLDVAATAAVAGNVDTSPAAPAKPLSQYGQSINNLLDTPKLQAMQQKIAQNNPALAQQIEKTRQQQLEAITKQEKIFDEKFMSSKKNINNILEKNVENIKNITTERNVQNVVNTPNTVPAGMAPALKTTPTDNTVVTTVPEEQAVAEMPKNVEEPVEATEQPVTAAAGKTLVVAKNTRKEPANKVLGNRGQMLDNEQYLKAVEQVIQAMEQKKQAMMKNWDVVPEQRYTAGSPAKDKDKIAKAAEAARKAANAKADLKAGTIVFAVLETAINSDEPGPILARVVDNSKLKGATLIGTMSVNNERSQKIALQFQTMNFPDQDFSNAINAVAVDPQTARTAIASNVDNHYLLRWGSLFASSFLQGYTQAVAQSGSTVQTITSPTATATTTNRPSMSPKQQIFQGVSEIGKAWTDIASKNSEIKPTITVDAGTSIGVLIISDLKFNNPAATTADVSDQTTSNKVVVPAKEPVEKPVVTSNTATAATKETTNNAK